MSMSISKKHDDHDINHDHKNNDNTDLPPLIIIMIINVHNHDGYPSLSPPSRVPNHSQPRFSIALWSEVSSPSGHFDDQRNCVDYKSRIIMIIILASHLPSSPMGWKRSLYQGRSLRRIEKILKRFSFENNKIQPVFKKNMQTSICKPDKLGQTATFILKVIFVIFKQMFFFVAQTWEEGICHPISFPACVLVCFLEHRVFPQICTMYL